MKLKKLILLVVLMGIFSFLFGCGKKNNPVELAEDAKLTGLYLSRQGMMMTPYYIMKTTESGTYMKISDLCPDDYEMWKDEDTDPLERPAAYFAFVDTVKDVEHASLVRLEEETLIRRLEEIIEKYGALGWDGFKESKSMTGVMDSGDRYDLYLEFSDGTTVIVDGYNVAPKGFDDFYQEIVDVFQNNRD